MPRVFSLIGFRCYYGPKFPFFESRIYRISRIRRDAMRRVFSPTGSNVIFNLFHLGLNHGYYMIMQVLVHHNYHVCRGEVHSTFHDTDTFPYLKNDGVFPSYYRRIRKLIKQMDNLLVMVNGIKKQVMVKKGRIQFAPT